MTADASRGDRPEPSPAASSPPVFALRGVSKRFGEVAALQEVDLELHAGEVHALLGENGAGKSTAVKILAGMLQPGEGAVLARGETVALASPAEARRRGVGVVFQHFAQFEALSVLENIAAAMPASWSVSQVSARATEAASRYGLSVHLDRRIAALSAGERQRVEILRCLLADPHLLILDEPTSVLTPEEAEGLANVLRRLAGEGRAILYITHRLEEVRALCDQVTVLRGGRVVARLDPRVTSVSELAAAMVGPGVAVAGCDVETAGRLEQPVRLRVAGLSAKPDAGGRVGLRDVSLAVRGGEVLGVAGIAGNGQSALFDVLSGETRPLAGRIEIDGRDVTEDGVNARRRQGAAFLAEDRAAHAGVAALNLTDNALLSRHATRDSFVTRGVIQRGRIREAVDAIRGRFDVRAPAGDPAARTLSGGNLQKFLVGREIERAPSVLVVDQPTWGVDVRAAAAIRSRLRALAAAGAAILVISQDLDEIFEIADRIAVLADGRLSEAMPRAVATREAVGVLMAGAARMNAAKAGEAPRAA